MLTVDDTSRLGEIDVPTLILWGEHDAFQQREAMTFAAFSDIRHLIHDMVAEGDRVAFRMTIEMTHTADFMGIPASSKRVSIVGIGIMRIANGKIAEFWGFPDVMSLMQQIGALPTPDQHASA